MKIKKALLITFFMMAAVLLFAQPPCETNPLANDFCSSATPIENTNGYCGNTSNTYTSTVSSTDLTSENNTPLGSVFCGSMENNSWFSFVAGSTSATFDIWPSNCADGYGIQMEIFSTSNCFNFISVSNCYNPGTPAQGTITANGLTIGQTYFIMIDGNAGDVCDYVLAVTSGLLSVNAGPDQNIVCGETATLQSFVPASFGTVTYQWSPALGLNNTQIAHPIASPTETTTYYMTAIHGVDTYTDSVTVFVNPMPAVEICYVEFDTISQRNRITWPLGLSLNIDSVFVYNEITTNVWSLIGTVPASESYFIDNNSNPSNQSYSYKISVIDTCGNKTDSSEFHTTITLLAAYDQGTNTYGFTWSAYHGLSISSYNLYGINSAGNVTLIGTVPGNQYFYNFTNPSPLFIKYFIGFETTDCSNKTNHLVKSNVVQSTFTDLSENTDINNFVSVFPNPVKNKINISTDLIVKTIAITDITGRLLLTTCNKNIDCKDFSKGIYFVKISTDKGIVIKRFVIE